jgi:predicted permease
MGGGTWFSVMAVDDSMNNEPRAYLHNIGPHFFETMQIPLLLGRTLKPEDATASSKVAVINQALAKRLFKDANPVGKHFTYAEPNMQDHPGFEVVGVVLDARYHRIEEDNPPTMYIPFAEGPTEATFEVRTRIEPSAAVAAIRNTVAGIDRNLPLIEVTTLEDQIRSEIGLYRMFAAFSTVFSVFAVLMASVGLYGVISYTVTRRIHELGIRMALGARPADVIRLVVSGIWLITGAGLVAGIISAVVVTRLIADWLLYGVTFYDPPTIVIAALVITFVSAAAAYVPASRAARLDPMVALRYE